METVVPVADEAMRAVPRRRPRSPFLRSVCVFSGTNPAVDPDFVPAGADVLSCAADLGRAIALEGIQLIYGGGASGLTGAVARAAAEGGGSVTVVVPELLSNRIPGLRAAHAVISVPDMPARTDLMVDRADALIALPGATGAPFALNDAVTLHALARHGKPVVIANFGGRWTPLMRSIVRLRLSGLIRAEAFEHCAVAERPDAVLPLLRTLLEAFEVVRRLNRRHGPVSSSGEATAPGPGFWQT